MVISGDLPGGGQFLGSAEGYEKALEVASGLQAEAQDVQEDAGDSRVAMSLGRIAGWLESGLITEQEAAELRAEVTGSSNTPE